MPFFLCSEMRIPSKIYPLPMIHWAKDALPSHRTRADPIRVTTKAQPVGHTGAPIAVTHPLPRSERREVERFLDALERQVHTLTESTSHLVRSLQEDHKEGMPTHFSSYVRTRDLTSECWAFSIVIERHIDLLDPQEALPFRLRFTQLTVKIWTALLDCSLKFLDALSREANLPLGSREVFVREIKTLYDASRWLADERYEGLIDQDMQVKQRQAERILTTIVDRAPALLELG